MYDLIGEIYLAIDHADLGFEFFQFGVIKRQLLFLALAHLIDILQKDDLCSQPNLPC